MVVTSLIWLARVHLFYFSFLLKIAHLDSLPLFHPSICFHSFSYSFISEDRSSMFLLFPFTFYNPASAFSAIFFLSAHVHSFFSILVLLFLPPASFFEAFTFFSCLFTRHSFPYFSPFFFCLHSITFLALPQYFPVCPYLPLISFPSNFQPSFLVFPQTSHHFLFPHHHCHHHHFHSLPSLHSSPKAGEHGVGMQMVRRRGGVAGVVPAGCLLPRCQGLQLSVQLHQEGSAAGGSSHKESQHHSVCFVSVVGLFQL